MPTLEEQKGLNEADDLELSEDELDAVAGGAFIEPNIVRQPRPSIGFDDPIIARGTSTGFENPVIANPGTGTLRGR